MASPTPLLGFILPIQGDLSGTWGDTINTSITSLVETAIAGVTTLSADADVTLTSTNYVANQDRSAILRWTAGNTVTRYITIQDRSKVYVVSNESSGDARVVVRGFSGPTTGVTIPPSTTAVIAYIGSDFKLIGGFAGVPPTNIASALTYTVVAADFGTQIALVPSALVTLPSTALMGSQFTIIGPTSGTATIQPSGGGSVLRKAGVAGNAASITLNPNAVVRCLQVNSASGGFATWVAEGTGMV